MARTRTTASICGLALAVALLSGCGGSDGDDAAPTTSAPTAATATTAPTATSRPADTSFSGQDSAEFCVHARRFHEGSGRLRDSRTPGEVGAAVSAAQPAITQAVSAAPAEIKNDAEVVAGAFTRLRGELEKVDFELKRAPPDVLKAMFSPEFLASSTRVEAYVRSVCGAG